ncbi:MAG TPA: amino acid permease [Acidimicrobiales bacterium]|nr:amino acid permease [Acidimicrobiales bacterium]
MSEPSVPLGLSGPRPAPPRVVLPEPLGYRWKRRLLGPPLVTERLADERLANPIALGVLAPDCISSTAYGSEEILTELIPAVGVAAFSLLVPITFAVIAVLIFITLSYREVVMAYTKAGGAYVVARENFGPRVAQVAAVALIIDYVVTVAVQISAGTDAVTSAFPALSPYNVAICLGVVVLMCYGNLRGIREAGRMFALPTYLFVTACALVIVFGIVRSALGELHHHSVHMAGAVPAGHPGSGLLYGASLFIILRSFANGGSSLTGLEAISNGVATFRPPEGRNARRVLVVMSVTLGSLVLGVSFLATVTHAVPFMTGSPTVLSQEARYVFGSGLFAKVGYYFVQGATMLILYTGGNTSFNGFPNLASFVAEDAFLPRQLTRRGHRLVFSNGILILAALSAILLVITQARVNSLVSVYAIGVFTGFTMAGAGMVRYHLAHRPPGWRHRLVVNGFASGLAFIVVLILAVAKFTEGAWVVVVLFPVLVAVLIRMHHVYAEEKAELQENVTRAAEAPMLRRHVIFLFIGAFDLAAARALQYGRTLGAGEPRVVHFVLDTTAARELEVQWSTLGISRVPLELIECPDRRLGRAAMELVAAAAADGETEVTVLLPRRVSDGVLRRFLHDRTSERIAALVGEIPNAAATIVPFLLGRRHRLRPGRERGPFLEEGTAPLAAPEGGALPAPEPSSGTTPIGSLRWRERARAGGRVHAVRVQPGSGLSSLECVLVDASGELLVVFQGRRSLPGIVPGAHLLVEGTVGERGGRVAMLNPSYTILARAVEERPPG